MHPEYKLIRFSNGDQIIGEVLEEKPHVVRVRNMFKVVNRESRQGYVTGIIGWLSFIDQDEVKSVFKKNLLKSVFIYHEISSNLNLHEHFPPFIYYFEGKIKKNVLEMSRI